MTSDNGNNIFTTLSVPYTNYLSPQPNQTLLKHYHVIESGMVFGSNKCNQDVIHIIGSNTRGPWNNGNYKFTLNNLKQFNIFILNGLNG
jgi:hypothetical protein